MFEHGFPLLTGDDALRELLGCAMLYGHIALRELVLAVYAALVGGGWASAVAFSFQQLVYMSYATGCVQQRDARGIFKVFGRKDWGKLAAELDETARERVELLPKE